jgi:hypothetical protein
MAFDKGHEKLGGRQKGTGNKATVELKELLNRTKLNFGASPRIRGSGDRHESV